MCNFERTKFFPLVLENEKRDNNSQFSTFNCQLNKSGDNGVKVPLVPIPNTQVKLHSADGTAGEILWKSRTLPD